MSSDLAPRELLQDAFPVRFEVPADEDELRPVRGKLLEVPPPRHVVEELAPPAGEADESLGPVHRFGERGQDRLEAFAIEELLRAEPEGLELEVVVVIGGGGACLPPDFEAEEQPGVDARADGRMEDRPRVVPADLLLHRLELCRL